VSRFLLVCALGTLWAQAARADVFSPGPLAKPHGKLDGISNCTKCHTFGGGEEHFQQKCLECHQELQPRVAKGTGFHGRLSDEKRDCQHCHNEHQGADFDLIDWVPSQQAFPHADTGWPLKGKHSTVKCTDCHQPRLIQAKDVKRWMDENPSQKQTYLGLSTTCATCHFDEHRTQLGTKCEICHTEKGWSPAPGFNHAKTDYPLTGKHREVGCEKCHELKADTATAPGVFPAPVKKQFPAYSDLAHASCLDCHQDPHKGSFGAGCASCHSTVGWKVVHAAEAQRSFHDKTRYPLKGLHAEVECRACHGPFPGRPARFKNLAFQSCTDCHVDAHEGQLAEARTHKTTCENCHTVAGFVPARYEIADHEKSRFPLEGAHQSTPCSLCHVAKPALAARIPASVTRQLKLQRRSSLLSTTLFQIPGALNECETCHRDPHAGQFKSASESLACTRCHQQNSFFDLTFNHDHDSRFPLTGKHAVAQCAQCHQAERIHGATATRYRPIDMRCAGCHVDVHAGQFQKTDSSEEALDCATCHDTQAFKPAPAFVHAPPFTKFLLEGKHADVKCEACHQDVSIGGTRVVRRYVGLPTTCAGCHQDFHNGAFQGFVP
jgi:Cytochrome c3